MNYSIIKVNLLAVLLILFSTELVYSQVLPGEPGLGVQYSVVPVLGYSSDYGLFGGGFVQRIDYGFGVRPYRSNSAAEFTISTKGNIISKLDHESLESFGTDLRSRFRFDGIRLLKNTYFGIGNDTSFSTDEFDDGRYYFEERTLKFRYWGRKNIIKYGQYGDIDGMILATVSNSNPLSEGDDTIFNTFRPDGFEGGWVNKAGAGIVIDNRDSEFNPTYGYLFESNISVSGRVIGSGYNFHKAYAEFRGYFSPIRDLVIAQKLEFQHASGDVPFWEMPVLGNELGLRGYVLNRFRGNSSLLHIIELRTWLFGILEDQIMFGGQMFMDTGRVFTGEDRFSDLTNDLKHTFGIGGAVSILNPDFIFRGDLAFSEDIYRIYLSVGYLF